METILGNYTWKSGSVQAMMGNYTWKLGNYTWGLGHFTWKLENVNIFAIDGTVDRHKNFDFKSNFNVEMINNISMINLIIGFFSSAIIGYAMIDWLLSMISCAACPRTQRKPLLSGLSLSPEILMSFPSVTFATIPHRVGWQFMGHMVWMDLVSGISTNGCHYFCLDKIRQGWTNATIMGSGIIHLWMLDSGV